MLSSGGAFLLTGECDEVRGRLRHWPRDIALLVLLVALAYVAGFRYERAILRVMTDGPASGAVVVNRLAETNMRARFSLQSNSYRVHPRDFEAELTVLQGAAQAEFVVYRGKRVVRRAHGRAVAGERLLLAGDAFTTRSRSEEFHH